MKLKATILFVLALFSAMLSNAQNKKEPKDGQITLKIQKNINGKITTIDTTININSDINFKEMDELSELKELDIKIDGLDSLLSNLNLDINIEENDKKMKLKMEGFESNKGLNLEIDKEFIEIMEQFGKKMEELSKEFEKEIEINEEKLERTLEKMQMKKICISVEDEKLDEIEKAQKIEKKIKIIGIDKTLKIKILKNDKKENLKDLELNKLEVFPNPNNGFFNLEYNSEDKTPIDLIIYTLDGKEIYSEKVFQENNTFSKKINLDNVPKGVYLMEIKQSGIKTSRKIIIE